MVLCSLLSRLRSEGKLWPMAFPATIKNGNIFFGSPEAYVKWRHWAEPREGKRVVIEEETKPRTLPQNSYYWAYLSIIEKETGQLATDVHEWAKRKFLPPRFITVNGEELKVPGSTAALDKLAFGEYLDKIAAETNMALPDPEAAGYISNTNV